jgi:hypothetical protein
MSMKGQKFSTRRCKSLKPLFLRSISSAEVWAKYFLLFFHTPSLPSGPGFSKVNSSATLVHKSTRESEIWQALLYETKELVGFTRVSLQIWWRESLKREYTSTFMRFSRVCFSPSFKIIQFFDNSYFFIQYPNNHEKEYQNWEFR